jgi:transposase
MMAGWRRAVELAMTDEEIERLTALSRSRTEPAGRVSRAQMLLAYRENPSFCAVGQSVGVHHQTVQRCVERALGYGPLAAIEDRPRPGKEPVITPEAKAWLVSLACDKAKEHGYPHELWTTRLLARHAREHGPASGHECLAKLVQGTVCKNSLARRSTIWTLRVHLHTQARLVAQPHRGLLLQVRSFGPAPHPGDFKTRAQGAHLGRYRRCQSPSRHPHLVIQARRGSLI